MSNICTVYERLHNKNLAHYEQSRERPMYLLSCTVNPQRQHVMYTFAHIWIYLRWGDAQMAGFDAATKWHLMVCAESNLRDLIAHS